MSNHSRSTRARRTRADASSSRQDFRKVRSERLLLEELRRLLFEAADSRLGRVLPVSLELTPDGRHARVAYLAEVASEEEARREVRPAPERASAFLRAGLASGLGLARVPTLGFTLLGVRDAGASGEVQP